MISRCYSMWCANEPYRWSWWCLSVLSLHCRIHHLHLFAGMIPLCYLMRCMKLQHCLRYQCLSVLSRQYRKYHFHLIAMLVCFCPWSAIELVFDVNAVPTLVFMDPCEASVCFKFAIYVLMAVRSVSIWARASISKSCRPVNDSIVLLIVLIWCCTVSVVMMDPIVFRVSHLILHQIQWMMRPV